MKKCRFDENQKSQMPEGTLNRTFCLSKIPFGLFFGQNIPQNTILYHFLIKIHPKIRFYTIFWPNYIQNPILQEFLAKITPKTRFYKHFFNKLPPKHDFISIFYKIPLKYAFYKHFSKNPFFYRAAAAAGGPF